MPLLLILTVIQRAVFGSGPKNPEAASFTRMFEGVLSMLGGLIAASVSTVFNNVNWLYAHAILGAVHFFAALPGGHLFVEMPKRHPVCELTIFDLAGGGSAHLRDEGADWLIDCGSNFNYENIVRQFLLEAATLTTLGGLAGVGVGYALARMISHFADWPIVLTSGSILLSLAVSCISGLAFGFWPAHQAAKVNPIEALRSD